MYDASAPLQVMHVTPVENPQHQNSPVTKEEVLSFLTFVASFACYLFIYLFINFQCLPNRLVQSPENIDEDNGIVSEGRYRELRRVASGGELLLVYAGR